MYGGTALYGFLSAEEKSIFELFRDAIPATGAKKAAILGTYCPVNQQQS
jgi:Holliday junction resolvasome RuvABC DNA-binding subunit